MVVPWQARSLANTGHYVRKGLNRDGKEPSNSGDGRQPTQHRARCQPHSPRRRMGALSRVSWTATVSSTLSIVTQNSIPQPRLDGRVDLQPL